MRRALAALVAVTALAACSGLYSDLDGGTGGGAGGSGGGGSGGTGGGGSGGSGGAGGAGGGAGGSGGSGGAGGAGGGGGSGGGGGGGGAGGGGSGGPLGYTFMPLTPPASTRLTAVSGSASNRLWVGSIEGDVYFSNGVTFVPVANVGQPVRGVYVTPTAPSESVVVSFATGIARCNSGCSSAGATFTETSAVSGADVYGVCGKGSAELYAAAMHSSGNAIVYGVQGTTLQQLSYTSNVKDLRACAVQPSGRALFGGMRDITTYRPDGGGTSWEYPTLTSLGTEAQVQQWHALAVDPADGGAVAVGVSRRAIRRSGSGTWTLVFNPLPADAGLSFRAVINQGPGEYWAGGDPRSGQGLAYDDGTGFQFISAPAGMTVHGMWSAGPNLFYVVGEQAGVASMVKASR